MHEVERLPAELVGLPNGHCGSHQFLVHDFFEAMQTGKLPPFMEDETPDALSEDAPRELGAIPQLCERLHAKGDTRLVFTSRVPGSATCYGGDGEKRLGEKGAVEYTPQSD